MNRDNLTCLECGNKYPYSKRKSCFCSDKCSQLYAIKAKREEIIEDHICNIKILISEEIKKLVEKLQEEADSE